MVDHDNEVTEQFTESLYARARSIIATSTIVGALLGLGVGYIIEQMTPVLRGPVPIGGAVTLGLLGLAVGRARALPIKLMAYDVLCHRRIDTVPTTHSRERTLLR